MVHFTVALMSMKKIKRVSLIKADYVCSTYDAPEAGYISIQEGDNDSFMFCCGRLFRLEVQFSSVADIRYYDNKKAEWEIVLEDGARIYVTPEE
jgi:hypothetical protein